MIRDTLGPTLRAMRGRAGLTTEALGARLGVSGPCVSRWDNGTNEPSIDRIAAYATACGMRLDLAFVPANVRVKRWGYEAHEAADLLESATPEDRALFLTVLRRMASTNSEPK